MEKYTEIKVSDDGNWVMVCNYNAFSIFDKELNQKGEAKDLKCKFQDYDYTSFYDLWVMPGGDFVANLESGS